MDGIFKVLGFVLLAVAIIGAIFAGQTLSLIFGIALTIFLLVTMVLIFSDGRIFKCIICCIVGIVAYFIGGCIAALLSKESGAWLAGKVMCTGYLLSIIPFNGLADRWLD